MSRNVYQAIMIAAAQDKGLRITAKEAHQLAMDDAIETVANNSLPEADYDNLGVSNHWDFWRKFARRKAPSPVSRDSTP
jgi:hypothetical protein